MTVSTDCTYVASPQDKIHLVCPDAIMTMTQNVTQVVARTWVDALMPYVAPTLWGIIVVVALYALFRFIKASHVVVYIPNDRIGIVEKMWSAKHGSVHSGFIALAGEAGYQPDVLRGGFHFFFPYGYRVHVQTLVAITQGQIGYVFARDGVALAPSQTLAANTGAADFTDARAFLTGGGQKGPQRKVLREGTYAINLAQFVVVSRDHIFSLDMSKEEADSIDHTAKVLADRGGYEPVIIKDANDELGVVTVHDGPSLEPGEIIAPTVVSHSSFQDPELFLAAGGRRGRQLEVIVEGSYFINRLFATVEMKPKYEVAVGFAGVVIFYAGQRGDDLSADDYHHGELVATGARGVWKDALLPGKYAFNPYAGKIAQIPTTNFILEWEKGASTSAMKLDENLSEISLITKDAFEPNLPLSVVLHIDYEKAPQIIQRFGDVKNLVNQTLDPMVAAYFKNIAQGKTLIELLQERASIQNQAHSEMKERFALYSLELQEVLIGTPRAAQGDGTIEGILLQLRSRQVAREQIETYTEQGKAATKERELNEAKAVAEAQSALTRSSIQVRVMENEGSAELARANKQAETIRVMATANATKRQLEGDGEAAAITAIGNANATATKAQVDAYGGPEFRLAEQVATRMFEAVKEGKQPIVPSTVIGGGQSDLLTGLMANVMLMAKSLTGPKPAP